VEDGLRDGLVSNLKRLEPQHVNRVNGDFNSMLLSLLTWPEVQEYLTKSTVIIIPTGSTEQHGPTGLIGTDALCAEALAKEVGAATGTLVTPTLSVGFAEHHLEFPGSISVSFATFEAILREWIGSLAGQGFREFFLINGHGGNQPVFDEAVPRISTEYSIEITVNNWWECIGVQGLCNAAFDGREGLHATVSEIALTQFLFPQRFEGRIGKQLVPQCAPTLSVDQLKEIGDAKAFRQRFPDGRVGSDPSLANPDIGKLVWDAAIRDLTESLLNRHSAVR
jgi:creatinine amidohydrolase